MKLQIRGDKVIITKAIKEYITEKIGKLDRYFESNNELTAIINVRVKNNLQIIEVTIPTKQFTIRAEENHNDLYASIDLVVDKLERQITKNKEKIAKKYKNIPGLEINIDFETEEDEDDIKIVKRKNLDSKPMDEEEAILQMQLVNHDFFVFKNVDEECVSVLYKRKDNKLGIINVK